METIEVAFTVRSFESDAFGYLAPAALAGYLQEAAGQSADSLGFGLSNLNRKGLTCVLVREQFALNEPIRMGDTVQVETWPSGIDRWAVLRDFRLLKGDREVGRALTSWFVLDLQTRHPVRPKLVLTDTYHAQTPHVLPVMSEPLAALAEASLQRRFQVRFADIDANLHVTNASYITWVLEALDEAAWRDQYLKSLDIQFLAECSLGTFVYSRSAIEAPGRRRHSVIREEDEKELARATTEWTVK